MGESSHIRRTHLIVWPLALAAYFVVLSRFVYIAWLDLEALLRNLFHVYAAREAWIPYARFFALWGALPLSTLFFAGLAFRVLARRYHHPNPVTGLSTRAKTLLFFLVFTPFAGFAAAFASSLSVWVAIEAFWWIEWYDNIHPAMEWILIYAPLLVWPGLLVAGIVAFRVAVAAPRERKPSPLWRVSRALLVLVPALGLIVFGAAGSLHVSRVAAKPGLGVFSQRCGACHERSRALYLIKTPVEWGRTLTRMREFEKAPISRQEGEDVASFLTGMRSFSDSWTFRTRCRRCHTGAPSGWEKRRPEDWSAIAARLARWSPYYYRHDVRGQVAAYLAEAKSDPAATLGLSAEDYQRFHDFAQFCGACHTMSRQSTHYVSQNDADLRRLVARMTQKTAAAPPNDIDFFVKTYRDLLGDRSVYRRLFPHDEPVLEGGLPW
ncbi:MAG: hypothetical protein P9L99_10970 [Candidatus Lernaella stagnicola]|nr:hypothetical protein [Candidatus Lernaella stagnicola]